MTNLRRLMVVVLAIAMIATSMATAFGAPLSDISGKKYEDAVNKLVAFNIAEGIDGQFKGEDKLTRAQFATFITKMMGLGALDKVDTIFSDATANDWFSGYVNAVSEAGYMVGADGKFNPDKNVTYGEAITVLMKMLGYAPVVNNRGTWPSNYISRAGSIKLTKDVSVSASAYVTRGNLAILIWNTLTTNKLVEGDTYDEDGNPTYKVAADADNKTLLFENFNEAKEVKEKVVTTVPMTSAGFENNVIEVDGDDYTVPAGTDANALLGLEVTYVADKDNNIKWIGVTTDKDDIVTDTIKTYVLATDNLTVDTITFTKIDKAFKVASNVKVFYNGIDVSPMYNKFTNIMAKVAEKDKYAWGVQDTATITAILNDDKQIAYAFISQDLTEAGRPTWDNDNDRNNVFVAPAVATAEVVSADTRTGIVNSVGDKIKGEGFGDINRKDLNEKAALGISKNIVYKDGKVAKLTDIKKGDIIRYSKINGGVIIWAFTPVIETVKIDTLEDVTNTTLVKLVSGDKKYQLSSFSMYSYNNGTDKYTTVVNTTTPTNTLTNFVGAEGTKLYLAPSGKVVYIENAVADSDYLYGVVTKRDDGTNAKGDSTDKLTIFKADGSTATYITKDPVNENSFLDKMVAYKLSTKNEISTIDLAANINAITSVNGTNSYIAYNDVSVTPAVAKTASVIGSSVFFNLVTPHSGTTAAEVEIVDWDVVKDDSSLASIGSGAAVAVEKGLVKAAFLNETAFGATSRFGMVVGSGVIDGEQTIKVNYEGTVSEYTVASATYMNYAVKGLLIQYSITGDDIYVAGVGPTVKATEYNAATGKVKYIRPGKSTYTNGTAGDANVTGKVGSVDTANRVLTFKWMKNNAGDLNDPADEFAVYVAKDVQIFDIRDTSAITYSEDLATLTAGLAFSYDTVNNIIVIVKGSSTPELTQLMEP